MMMKEKKKRKKKKKKFAIKPSKQKGGNNNEACDNIYAALQRDCDVLQFSNQYVIGQRFAVEVWEAEHKRGSGLECGITSRHVPVLRAHPHLKHEMFYFILYN